MLMVIGSRFDTMGVRRQGSLPDADKTIVMRNTIFDEKWGRCCFTHALSKLDMTRKPSASTGAIAGGSSVSGFRWLRPVECEA